MTKERNKMHTHFGMRTYLTIQESEGEGDKQDGGEDGREGNGRREQFKVNTLGEGTGSKERIEPMGSRIGWREI